MNSNSTLNKQNKSCNVHLNDTCLEISKSKSIFSKTILICFFFFYSGLSEYINRKYTIFSVSPQLEPCQLFAASASPHTGYSDQHCGMNTMDYQILIRYFTRKRVKLCVMLSKLLYSATTERNNAHTTRFEL